MQLQIGTIRRGEQPESGRPAAARIAGRSRIRPSESRFVRYEEAGSRERQSQYSNPSLRCTNRPLNPPGAYWL